MAIAGIGLRYVEHMSGRVTTGRAALTGAGRGALLVDDGFAGAAEQTLARMSASLR